MSESNGHTKRVTCKRPHPNQRVHELLQSLYRDAVIARSNIVSTLEEAISSLEKYPLPLTSGADCGILKGFDQKLCNLIDLHLSGQLSRNKKSKISENGNSSVLKLKPSPPVEESSDFEMTSLSKKNPRNIKKKKQLETNSKKCSFESKFGETNINDAADTDMPFFTSNGLNKTFNHNENATVINNKPNIESAMNGEKNNNSTISDCHDEVCSGNEPLDLYFVNKSIKDRLSSTSYNEKCNFKVCENWDSLSNDQCSQFKNEYEANTRNCYQPVHVLDPNEDDESSSDESIAEIIVSSDDESIVQPPTTTQLRECLHSNTVVYCKQCESITTAADAFKLYFKEKTKKDAEEIEKCVLPRKMYKPAYRSGAYAILVALLEQRNECPYRDCLTKEELIQKAQKHTDESFTNPKPESNYTAWTNVNRLITKGMIEITHFEHRNEEFYMLTAMGRAVAMEILKDHTPKVTINDVIFNGQRNDRVPSLEDVVLVPPPQIGSLDEEQSSVFIEMPPGTFDIVMLIDKRENFDLPASPNNYCKYEARSLTIGDFIWVARSKKTGQELVLPYIIERKRMDDLSASIKDGRYHEQKFRLRKCGLKNVLYLVESCKNNGKNNLPVSSLMQAVVNTNILEEFNVVKTGSLNHTFRFLGMLSESLVHEFLPEFLRGCNKDTNGKELMTFEFFNKFSCKNKPLTVRDTFIKMLLQLKGLSVEKALAITNKYSTPRALMKAYEKCTVKEGELLLATLKYNNFSRNVGPTVSKTIYKLFSQSEF